MHDGSTDKRPTNRGVARRDFLKAAGASGAAAGLAGCTAHPLAGTIAGGAGTGGSTLQWMAGTDEVGASGQVKQALYDAGLSQDIGIEIITGPRDTTAKQQQLQRWFSGGLEKPDIIQMDSGWTIPFIKRGQTLNLTKSEAFPDSYVERIEESYFEASVQTAKDPGTGDLHAVPFYPDFPTMLYRRDLVEEAGHSPGQENWATESIRWRRFAQVVRDVLDRNDDLGYGFTFQANTYGGLSCCDFNEFMTSWGGAYFGGRDTLFGPVGERPVTVGEQPVIDSVRMIRSFISGPDASGAHPDYPGPISPRAVLGWVENTSLAPFTNGNAVANRNWPYAISNATADDALGDRLGVMPIPYAVPQQQTEYENIGGPVAALGGWHHVINPNSNNIEESVQVLQAMAEPSFKYRIFELIGFIPPEPELLNSRRARQVSGVGNFVEQLRIAGENAIPRPVTVVWPQQSTQIFQIVNSAYAGGIGPEQAMMSLQSTLENIEDYAQ
jgi:ABC-type glycerol-3-phosphate transport system substrate-binding protein